MELLLCDLDDTLVERSAAFRIWAATFLRKHRIPPGELGWLVARDDDGCRTRTELFELIIDRYRIDADAAALTRTYESAFPRLFRVSPAVRTALVAARSSGWRTAVVTNGGRDVQNTKMLASGLHRLVDGWVVSDAEAYRKPDPEIFEIAANRVGHTLSGRTWVIGDDPATDVLGARRAGIRAAWLERGRAWPRSDVHPDLVATSFPEALRLLMGTPNEREGL